MLLAGLSALQCPAEPPAVASSMLAPSSTLQPFLDQDLSPILAPLNETGFTQPEVVASMKAAYADGLAAAPAPRKAAFAAAEAVCDAVTAAMAERRTAVAALRGATATHTSEADQPAGSSGQGQQKASSSDDFFTSTQQRAWSERAEILRDSVTKAYLRERELEREAGFPSSPPAMGAVPPPPTVPALAPPTATAAPAAPVRPPAGLTMVPALAPTRGSLRLDPHLVGTRWLSSYPVRPPGKEQASGLLPNGDVFRSGKVRAHWGVRGDQLFIYNFINHPDLLETYQLPIVNDTIYGVDALGTQLSLTPDRSVPARPNPTPTVGNPAPAHGPAYFGSGN